MRIEYSYQGLPGHGIVLISPASPQFSGLEEEIRSHAEPSDIIWLDSLSEEELKCGAILVNLAEKPIVSLAWQCLLEGAEGKSLPGCVCRLTADDWLVPLFGYSSNQVAYRYRNMVFPNSKRLIFSANLVGTNRDVRSPEPDEIGPEPCVRFGHRAADLSAFQPTRLTLELDGVFFEDGEFIGPNKLGLWEMVSWKAETVSEAARIVRCALDEGLVTEEILSRLDGFTGPVRGAAPPHRQIDLKQLEEFERADLAYRMRWYSDQRGPDALMSLLAAWPRRPRPNLRRSDQRASISGLPSGSDC